MSMGDRKAPALEVPRLEPLKTSLKDAYMAELLGDLGKVLEGVSALETALPALERRLESIFDDAAQKLSAVENDAAKRVRAIGEAAGSQAVEKAAGEQIKILVCDVGDAVDNLRGTAEQASKCLRSAVAKVSIWRQVGYCALSGAVAALLICVLFLAFGTGPVRLPGTANVECPTGLGPDDCSTFQVGAELNRLWPFLPKSERDYLAAVSTKVQ